MRLLVVTHWWTKDENDNLLKYRRNLDDIAVIYYSVVYLNLQIFYLKKVCIMI